MGHVLAARYLAKGYRTTYAELAAWLAHYADVPDAPSDLRPGAAPPAGARAGAAAPGRRRDARPAVAADDDGAPTPHAALVARQIRNLADTAPLRAERLLAGPEAKRLLDPDSRGALRAAIADAARRASGEPRRRRVRRCCDGAVDDALGRRARRLARSAGSARRARHFETAGAQSRALDLGQVRRRRSGRRGWRCASAAPRTSPTGCGIAAEEPRTFYGLLARRLLGIATGARFRRRSLHRARRARHPEPRGGPPRAGAHRRRRARPRRRAELRALAQRDRPALLQSLAALADRADLPAPEPAARGRARRRATAAITTARSIRCRAGRRTAASPSTARCCSR